MSKTCFTEHQSIAVIKSFEAGRTVKLPSGRCGAGDIHSDPHMGA